MYRYTLIIYLMAIQRMRTWNDDKSYSDTTKSGGKEGFGFISQRDKNRRRFRRGDMHSTGGSRRSRLSSHV